MHSHHISFARRVSSAHVRFGSTATAKATRLAASWDDIHIPSKIEQQQEAQKTGLSARLNFRRPQAAQTQDNAPAAPPLIPLGSRARVPKANAWPNSSPRVSQDTTPRKASPQIPIENSLEAAAAVSESAVDDANISWEKGLKIIEQSSSSPHARVRKPIAGRAWSPNASSPAPAKARTPSAARTSSPNSDARMRRAPSSATRKPVVGKSWSPDGGTVNTSTSVQRTKTLTPRAQMKLEKEAEEEEESARLALELSQSAENDSQNDPEMEYFWDETVKDGVSLMVPGLGQDARVWYETILRQNREPAAPDHTGPDIEISSHLHDLFGVDHAKQQSLMLSNLGALQRDAPVTVRPAVKKGKVNYQVRKVMQRHGGDYSHLQPQLDVTDLGRMRPSNIALLAMSRRAEASTDQRQTFGAVIASTLKGIDRVAKTV
ncbi:hypothetical protein BDP27DRAFT_1443821 [Rhodocollybia butyracea]|uniref:Uncharacterized protein n=1 Tax=Rhodocollybia butyracea TaxID=206335 RepID=A0A9P5Q577_9AGAR|nr:hypothetical protein BDP27DRAFT_1443821 [Rhodocollybia butyracea]